MVTQLATTVFL